jgi:hypothetical protein
MEQEEYFLSGKGLTPEKAKQAASFLEKSFEEGTQRNRNC